MVHWVYVVECDDDFIYVGETINLYKRLTQHIRGRGGKNTHAHIPRKLLGLYKVNDNTSFYQYVSAINHRVNTKNTIEMWGEYGDNLWVENRITERLIWERRNNHEYGTGMEWYRVRGGKYTRDTLDESLEWAYEMCQRPNHIPGNLFMTTPINSIPEDEIVDRPLCKCGMPSEVKVSRDKTKVYFVCALKNVWDNFYSGIEVSGPCDFWELYDTVRSYDPPLFIDD